MIPELLAPAGSYESLLAAVAAGADAVYVGGPRFGARAYADNPDEGRLLRGMDEAHLRGVRVYLTVNTLLKEAELGELGRYLAPLHRNGLDGVIVQDLGVLSAVRELFPDLPIHASTQMTVTGPHGAALLKKHGVSRVICARELSIPEIARIGELSGVETECFVHGSLCYAFSGQCLMSSFIGGRSGNRGRCAQPCRLGYRYDGALWGQRADENTTPAGHGAHGGVHGGGKAGGKAGGKGGGGFSDVAPLISLKDLCALELLPQLVDAGVASIKIEGRMKGPDYCAGVVSIYRKYLDLVRECRKVGAAYEVDPEDIIRLSCLFDRGGFTKGFLGGGADESFVVGARAGGVGASYVVGGRAGGADETYSAGGRAGGIGAAPAAGGSEQAGAGRLDAIELPRPHVRGDAGNPRDVGRVDAVAVPSPTPLGLTGRLTLHKGQPPVLRVDFCTGNAGTRGYARMAGWETFKAPLGRTGEVADHSTQCPGTEPFEAPLERMGDLPEAPTPLTGQDIVKTVSVRLDDWVVQEAKTSPLSQEDALRQVAKTGGSPFVFEKLAAEMDEDVFVPVSKLNQIRRDALAAMEEAMLSPFRRDGAARGDCAARWDGMGLGDGAAQRGGMGLGDGAAQRGGAADTNHQHTTGICVSVQSPGQLGAVLGFPKVDEVYLDITGFGPDVWKESVDSCHGAGKLCRLVFPYVFRMREELFMDNALPALKVAGFDGIMLHSLDQIGYLVYAGIDLPWGCDSSLYVWNHRSARFLADLGAMRLTLGLELNSGELAGLSAHLPGIGTEVVAYGHVPVMVSAACLEKITGRCKGDGARLRAGDGLSRNGPRKNDLPRNSSPRDDLPSNGLPKDNLRYVSNDAGGTWFSTLYDRMGKGLPVAHHCTFCYQTIYNYAPIWLVGMEKELQRASPDSMRLCFTAEPQEEIRRVLEAYTAVVANRRPADGVDLPGEFTRGHMRRGVE
ncbi:MAG: U32 family peptidase [Lachnospiraceae bacterium]|jgi:putative protease|nr:U32 family peptidase [Lachnospiraceae bacterium]